MFNTMDVRLGEFCVYIHYVDDEPIYVGMGSASRAFNFKLRSVQWKEKTANGYRVVIESWWPSKDKAYDHEVKLIKLLRPACNMVHNGWVQPGLAGNTWNIGRKHSEEAKKKLSASQKTSWEKTKRATGRRRPTKPIKCLDTGVVYDGLREAARQTGTHPSLISQCINNKRKHAAGLKFIRLDG